MWIAPQGPVYAVTFTAVAVTAAQDLFEITTSATTRALIRGIRIGQYTDAGDAAAEILSILLIRGYTVSGSGGSAATPANLRGWSGAPTAASACEVNNTTVANTGTAVTLLADTFNVQAGWSYYPAPDDHIVLDVSQRLVVRITAPADSLTMNGTLLFQEIGKVMA